MTKKEFDLIPHGEVFLSGTLPNSPLGLFMTNNGGELRWVAKKGFANDWAIYCYWSSHGIDWITQHGDKVQTKEHIRRCVPCDDEVLKCYRH